MASSKTRLVTTLATAGFPVDTVNITGPDSADITYMKGTSALVIEAATVYLKTEYDWSDTAEANWKNLQKIEEAKQQILSPDALPKATRAACIALMLSIQECRAKLNEVIVAVNAADGSQVPELQTGDSIPDAFAQVAALLDAGLVP